MPKYVIEREISGAGNLSPAELQAISQKSCGVLREMGPQIQWVNSYVTDDKVYCIYIAPSEDAIRELRIDTRGVRIGEPLTDFRGVLTGTPEYLGASEPLMEDRGAT